MIIHEQLTYRPRFLKTVQMYIHRSRNKYYPIRLNYYFCPKGDFILYYFWDLIEIWVSEQCIYLQTLFKASSWGKTLFGIHLWKSQWKPLYMVIKHSVMQTLLPIWWFLFVVLHKFTFSGESRSALLWILINWKPKKCHLMAILWGHFYQFHIFCKNLSFMNTKFVFPEFILYSYITWKCAPNGNKQYVTHIKSWFL